ncbi:Unknown protein, partial [Striga hermonthica]
PPYPYPNYSNFYCYDGYTTSQEYGPSHSYTTSQGRYDSYTSNHYETSYYQPSSPDYHQEVLTNTQEVLASLLSIIEEFHNWRIIPVPSVLQTQLTKVDSTVVSFLNLDTSHILLGRYSSLSAKVCRESARLEGKFRAMVEKFASLKEAGLTLVYDGTQSLDTSEDISDLYVRRISSHDDPGLQTTSNLHFGDGAITIDESESVDSEEVTVHGVGNNSLEDSLMRSEAEGARDHDCEEKIVHDVVDEVESLYEFIDSECALMNDLTHDVEYTSEMALVMTEMDSICYTDMFIIPEVDHRAIVRKQLHFLVIGVDIRARTHKNVATRVYFARLYSGLPTRLLLENTKAWHDRHFFLDP